MLSRINLFINSAEFEEIKNYKLKLRKFKNKSEQVEQKNKIKS